MYRLTVDLPNLADGGSIVIDGLGEFKAGDNDVSDLDVEVFEQTHTVAEPAMAVDDDGKEYQVGMTHIRKDIADLLESLEGVSIEYLGGEYGVPAEPVVATVNLDTGSKSTSDVEPDMQLDLGGSN